MRSTTSQDSPVTSLDSSLVTAVQPYVAQYRVPFWTVVRDHLAANGIRFEILVDADHPQARVRADSASLPFAREMPARRIRFGGRQVSMRRAWPAARGADLVILEQALGKPEILRLLTPRGPRPRIALMGHGWIRSRPTNAAERRFLDLLTRRADWFFAYTQSGADHVARVGVRPDRITVVNNSTDTRRLRSWFDSITDEDVRAERERLRLRSGPTLLYLGALDSSKRLDLLTAAADLISRREPELNVLVCGAGPLESQARAASETRPYLRILGPRFDRDKALVGRLSDTLVIPAAVGLVATDALAMRLPVVTTRGPGHGPEFDYLTEGVNAIVRDRTAEALAGAITEGLAMSKRTPTGDSSPIPSIEDSATAMAAGIKSALGTSGQATRASETTA